MFIGKISWLTLITSQIASATSELWPFIGTKNGKFFYGRIFWHFGTLVWYVIILEGSSYSLNCHIKLVSFLTETQTCECELFGTNHALDFKSFQGTQLLIIYQ
jgi:hypothetical protein